MFYDKTTGIFDRILSDFVVPLMASYFRSLEFF